MRVFVSWSGGKDTSLACYRAKNIDDFEVKYLLNMVSEDGKRSRSHGIGSDLLRAQAEAIGIPIVQRKTSWKTYEEEFKRAVSDLEKDGIEAGVFGDIDLQEHRDWVERVCREIGIKPILPLWTPPTHHPNIEREKLLKEFIQVGFKAIVIATNADFLGKEWLGREINGEFIEGLKAVGDIDLCGEKGEYHTFVYDGPILKKPLRFSAGKKTFKDKHWFLELVVRK